MAAGRGLPGGFGRGAQRRPPQRLLGAKTGPRVEDGAVVVRPEPVTGAQTPRQSLHNATPEPPRVRMPLTGMAGFDFQRVVGKDPTWMEQAAFEAAMQRYPELAPYRAELERKRFMKEQLEMVANNMDEGAGQAGAEEAPDASP
jgi:hypothetical protein